MRWVLGGEACTGSAFLSDASTVFGLGNCGLGGGTLTLGLDPLTLMVSLSGVKNGYDHQRGNREFSRLTSRPSASITSS